MVSGEQRISGQSPRRVCVRECVFLQRCWSERESFLWDGPLNFSFLGSWPDYRRVGDNDSLSFWDSLKSVAVQVIFRFTWSVDSHSDPWSHVRKVISWGKLIYSSVYLCPDIGVGWCHQDALLPSRLIWRVENLKRNIQAYNINVISTNVTIFRSLFAVTIGLPSAVLTWMLSFSNPFHSWCFHCWSGGCVSVCSHLERVCALDKKTL